MILICQIEHSWKKSNPKMMFLKQVEKILTIVPKSNEFPEPSDNYVSSAGLTCSFFNIFFHRSLLASVWENLWTFKIMCFFI